MRTRATINFQGDTYWVDVAKRELRSVSTPDSVLTLDTLPHELWEELDAALDERMEELQAFADLLYEKPSLAHDNNGAHKGWYA